LKTSIASHPFPARAATFVLLLLALWLPLAIPLYLFFHRDPDLVSLLTLTILYLEFLWLSRRWLRRIHGERGLAAYGLVWRERTAIEGVNGLWVGLSLPFALFLTGGLFGWITWRVPGMNPTRLVFEGALTAFGVGFAEESLFRGWLLYELSADYPSPVARWVSALLFAAAHFIKPLPEILSTFPQFPALVLLGATLAWLKRSCGDRLGMSIGLHAGLIWAYYILKVGGCVSPTGRVPSWITGIDNNPLAGAMGLFFLGILALGARRRALHFPPRK
jgi:membrane protease YdiL (CAAX protease family)